MTSTTAIFIISVIISITLPFLTKGDECSHLFFTPAWNQCFMRKFQNQFNWPQPDQPRARIFVPPIPPQPPMFQFQDEILPPFGNNDASNSFSSFSSSSSSGNYGSSTSTSVMSSNGRTWTVQSDGLSISSSSSNTLHYIKIFIDEPTSVSKNLDEADNKLKIDFNYADGSKRWVSIKLDSPTKVNELKIERKDKMMYIEGPI